jgi:hypothetical protein
VDTHEPEDLDALLAELAQGPDLSALIAELNTSTEALLEDLDFQDLPDPQ